MLSIKYILDVSVKNVLQVSFKMQKCNKKLMIKYATTNIFECFSGTFICRLIIEQNNIFKNKMFLPHSFILSKRISKNKNVIIQMITHSNDYI